MNVPCGHCHGTGRVAMPIEYATTYVAISRAWSTTGDVRLAHGDQPAHTALCNRLAWLYRNGFIQRRHVFGVRGYEWRRA